MRIRITMMAGSMPTSFNPLVQLGERFVSIKFFVR